MLLEKSFTSTPSLSKLLLTVVVPVLDRPDFPDKLKMNINDQRMARELEREMQNMRKCDHDNKRKIERGKSKTETDHNMNQFCSLTHFF